MFTHVAKRRNEGTHGTWIEPEELAYPSGALRNSRRKGRVILPNGKLVSVVLGVADTFFSIPARCTIAGKTVHGYVGCGDAVGITGRPEGAFYFQGYRDHKNGELADWLIDAE